MFVKVYYNYSPKRLSRGFRHGDHMVEVWDGDIPAYKSLTQAATYIFTYINSLDELSAPKLLGLVDMARGDVVYFSKEDVAYARTISGWRKIVNFLKPPKPIGT